MFECMVDISKIDFAYVKIDFSKNLSGWLF